MGTEEESTSKIAAEGDLVNHLVANRRASFRQDRQRLVKRNTASRRGGFDNSLPHEGKDKLWVKRGMTQLKQLCLIRTA